MKKRPRPKRDSFVYTPTAKAKPVHKRPPACGCGRWPAVLFDGEVGMCHDCWSVTPYAQKLKADTLRALIGEID